MRGNFAKFLPEVGGTATAVVETVRSCTAAAAP